MAKRIVIIGAGLGGLTAGNLLAKKGHRVTIFEAHTSPGGYTAGFRRKGFYFESGTLSFESSDTVFKVMKDIGVFEKIDFVRQPIALKSKKIDGVCHSYADLKKVVCDAYPKEKKALDRYFAEVDKMISAMRGSMQPRTGTDFLLFPVRMMQLVWFFRKYGKTNITEFTARYFDPSSDLFRLFKGMGYPDMSAAIIPGAYISFLDDYWTVKHGMQSWSDVLAGHFRNLGGELRLKSPVEKILTENGTAVGVISRKNEYRADVVISASDYKKTFLKLLDNRALIPEMQLKKIEKNAVSEGFFTVYLGLDIPPVELKRYLRVPHVSLDDEKPGADIHNSSDKDYFTKTSVMLYSPSIHDPELAPRGKSSLMIQAAVPYRWMDNWGGGDRKKYLELKDKVKKVLIAKAEISIPRLSRRIVFQDAATPLTYERYTANTDGATSAWSWNPANQFYRSIMSTHIDTPIKNLLIGSCWSVQIGGIPSAIGAAVKCARRIG